MENITLEHCYVNGHDGTPLFVEYAFNDLEFDVLLCDGIGCDGFIWSYLISELKLITNVVHPHMRGHGKSEVPSNLERLTMQDFADDLWQILAELRPEPRPLILLGHSMGVQVALEFMNRHPARCAAAVLLCGSFEHPATTFHHDDFLARVLPALKTLSALSKSPLGFIWKNALKLPLAFTVATLTETHPDRTERSIFEPYLQHLADMNLDVFFRTLDHANQHSARDFLQKLDLPILVIAGEDDKMTPPRLAGELTSLLPNARYFGVTDGTHVAPIEFPDEVNHVIKHFFAEIVSRRIDP
ncbi:MAG: alpha/beta fold hydrolase [Bradymonadia bacterium]